MSRSPLLELISSLDLDGVTRHGTNVVNYLATSEKARGLRRLNLANSGLTDQSAETLAGSPHLQRLTWLDLRNNRVTAEGVRTLLKCGHLPELNWLDLTGNDLGVAAMLELADWRRQRGRVRSVYGLPPRLTNSAGMEFALIPPGTFLMGSPDSEEGRFPGEGPQHEVEITRPFYLGIYSVTQEEYKLVTGKNPSWFSRRTTRRFPVESVSWDEAVHFCQRLSERPEDAKRGQLYRLPTEAEWEYACRAGGHPSHPFHSGPILAPEEANYSCSHCRAQPTNVGYFKPNAFGLHDMHGNVWEWCSDWLCGGYYHFSPARDPQGPSSSPVDRRALRGGSWETGEHYCRAACRAGLTPNARGRGFGFRVVLIPGEGVICQGLSNSYET